MNAPRSWSAALLIGLSAVPSAALARALSVELWTDRGADAVYQPGNAMEIEARVSEDAYLLVYEIDAEGNVHVLHPYRGASALIEGERRHRLSAGAADLELVVQGPVGQGFIVAIASRDRFTDLPWYLRPHDLQAEELGYHGRPGDESEEEEGVTAEGRLVGDPFVGMERIRRRVLQDPDDPSSFATAYVGYFVHHEVRYPRYLCNDCHRSGQWAWWDGFDPYYANCRVFDFRVNWSWGWGPRYWHGFIPYYVYVYRNDCPPRYRRHHGSGAWHSSWDGWRRWRQMWGHQLRRYKSSPPRGYVAPSKYDEPRRWRDGGRVPPGFVAGGPGMGRLRSPRMLPSGRVREPGVGRRDSRAGPADEPGVSREPRRIAREPGRSRAPSPRQGYDEPRRVRPRSDLPGRVVRPIEPDPTPKAPRAERPLRDRDPAPEPAAPGAVRRSPRYDAPPPERPRRSDHREVASPRAPEAPREKREWTPSAGDGRVRAEPRGERKRRDR